MIFLIPRKTNPFAPNLPQGFVIGNETYLKQEMGSVGKGRADYGNPDAHGMDVRKILRPSKPAGSLGDGGAMGKGAGNIVVKGEAGILALRFVLEFQFACSGPQLPQAGSVAL